MKIWLSMLKGYEQEFESDSLRALEIALGEFLERNSLRHHERQRERRSISLAFRAVLEQVPNCVTASLGAVEALLAFIESQKQGNDIRRKPCQERVSSL